MFAKYFFSFVQVNSELTVKIDKSNDTTNISKLLE